MGMSIRFCIGVIAIAIAAFAAALIGSAAAMGEIEAVTKFAGMSGFIEANWRELMSFGPAGCMLMGCLGGAMVGSGMHLRTPRVDLEFS